MATYPNYDQGSRPEWYGQYVSEPGRGTSIAALVCGIVGVVFGLIPILFVISLSLGCVAIVLGLIARSQRRHYPSLKKTMSTWALALGALALVLGVAGIAIVNSTMNQLDSDLDCIDRATTAEEIDACN
jgi:ABC-type nickel/cobalt efflux system permease component RcnA